MSTADQIKGLNLDDITLDDIYDFMESRGENMPDSLRRYMELMELAYNMDNKPLKYGSRELIIQHFVKVEGLSKYLAGRIYNDAMEYFYSQVSISKEAHRNRLAQQQELLYVLGLKTVETTQDVIRLMKAHAEIAKLLNLDKPDDFEMGEDEYKPPMKILSMDAEALQLPTRPNKEELRIWIDGLPELTEAQKQYIREETLLEPKQLVAESPEPSKEES